MSHLVSDSKRTVNEISREFHSFIWREKLHQNNVDVSDWSEWKTLGSTRWLLWRFRKIIEFFFQKPYKFPLTKVGVIKSWFFTGAKAKYVTCGSVLKLMNVDYRVRLHSHDVKYGTGSGQQSVTGTEIQEDANSHWTILAAHPKTCERGLVRSWMTQGSI